MQGLLPYAATYPLIKSFDHLFLAQTSTPPPSAAAATATAAAVGAGAGSTWQLSQLPRCQLLAGLGPAERAWLLGDVVKGLLLFTPAAEDADR
jgi:hypothetical protein